MNTDKNAQEEQARAKMEDWEDKEEEEEIRRISQFNPAAGCGRDEDRFMTK